MKAFVSAEMDKDLVDGLDEWARREGFNRSAAIRRILRDRLFPSPVSHTAGNGAMVCEDGKPYQGSPVSHTGRPAKKGRAA